MEENKNIDKFFAERLSDPDIAEEQWNTPPEGLWEAAQVQFPVTKTGWTIGSKIILGISSLAIVVATCISVNYLNKNNKEITVTTSKNNIARTSEQRIIPTPEIKTISPSTISKKTNSNLSSNVNTITTPTIEAIDEKTIQSENVVIKSIVNTTPAEEEQKLVSLSPTTVEEENTYTEITSKTPENKKQETSLKNKIVENPENISEIAAKPIPNNSSITQVPNSQKNSLLNNRTSIVIVETEEERSTNNISSPVMILPTIDKLASHSSVANSELRSMQKETTAFSRAPSPVAIIKPLRPYYPKHEAGLSRLNLIFDLIGDISLSSDDGEHVGLTNHYFNVNRTYSRWLSNKWSITSGLYISELDMDLDFSVFETITNSNINDFVLTEYNDIGNRNNSYMSTEDIDIMLLPSVTVAEGETIQLQGAIELLVNAVQIPFYINRHWYARRVDFYTGAGISVDFLTINQAGININLLRDDIEISEPYSQSDPQESRTEISYYVLGGMKVSITDFLNVGLSTRTNILNPLLTGIETGIYYRWNR